MVNMSDYRILCGFCDLLSGLLRRVLCAQNRRRGSIDTSYRELDEQETLRSDEVPTSTDSTTSGEVAPVQSKPCFGLRREKMFGSFREHPEWIKPSLALDYYPKQVELLLSKSASWSFDTLALDQATGGRCLPVLGMHLFEMYGLIASFKLLPEKCWQLFRMIEMGYKSSNPYHNAVHAADVTQAVHCFLQKSPVRELITNKIEIMSLLLAAMTHDLDHPGVSHSFLVATNNPLAIMYKEKLHGYEDKSPVPQPKKGDKKGRLLRSLLEQLAASKGRDIKIEPPAKDEADTSESTPRKKKKGKIPQCSSILEHHHWRMAYSTIVQSGVFEHSPQILPVMKQLLKSLILATDITRQNDYLDAFQGHLKRRSLDATIAEHRLLILQMALKTADISNPGRPWPISQKWSQRVCDEFFAQGDQERFLSLAVSKQCDRYSNTIPKIQIDFFRYVVSPLYRGWNNFVLTEASSKLLKNLLHNESEWRREDLLPGFHPTTISDIYYTEADLVQYSLGTSTNVSGSADVLLPSTPASEAASVGTRFAARHARCSSYSPIKKTGSLKDTIRRLSAPLDFFWEQRPLTQHKDSIPEDKLREELLAAAQSSDEQTSSDETKRSRRLDEMGALDRVVTIISERQRRLEKRTSRERQLAANDSSSGSNNEKSSHESPRKRPPQFVYDAARVGDSQPDSDDEASSDDKALSKLKPFNLPEESTSSSASQLTSSSVPISGAARLLLSQSNTPSAFSSESRFYLPLLTLKKVQSNCELMTGLKPSATAESALREAAAAGPARGRERRGSAPAPIAVSDLQQLATNLSLHKLGARTKHSASYHQIFTAKQVPAPARRGSLPVEVITSSRISAV